MLPGDRLLAIARLWFDEATIDRVFEPLVADWQREWSDASSMLTRSRCYVSGYLALVAATIRVAPQAFAMPVPMIALRSAVWTIVVFVFLGVALNAVLLKVPGSLAEYPVKGWLWLAPQFIVSSVAFALLPLALLVRARTTGAQRARVFLLQVTLALVLFIVLVGGWIVPRTNQEWRTIALRHLYGAAATPPARGIYELTTWELFTANAWPDDTTRINVVVERHGRVVSALLPIALAIFGWRLAGVSTRSPLVRGVLWWSFACGVAVIVGLVSNTFHQAHNWLDALVLWLLVVAFVAAARMVRPKGDPEGSPLQEDQKGTAS